MDVDAQQREHLITVAPHTTLSTTPTDTDNDVPQCRICLSSEYSDDLITPCLCSGSSQFVHRHCLDDWRAINVNRKAFTQCTVCHFCFVIDTVKTSKENDIRHERRQRMLVVRDVAAVIVTIIATILLFAKMIETLDRMNQSAILSAFSPSAIRPFTLYITASLILSLAFIGVFGLSMKCLGLEHRLVGVNHHDEYGSGGCCEDCGACCINTDCSGCCLRSHYSHGSLHSHSDGEGVFVVLMLVIVLVLAVFGLFYGLFYGSVLLQRLSRRHVQRRWYRVETEQSPVHDWTNDVQSLRNLARKAK